MQYIVILIALVLVGLLVQKQLTGAPDPKIEAVKQEAGVEVPTVPSRPQDVQQFSQDMNKFMEQQNADQQQKLKQFGE